VTQQSANQSAPFGETSLYGNQTSSVSARHEASKPNININIKQQHNNNNTTTALQSTAAAAAATTTPVRVPAADDNADPTSQS
jgi:hypothetical protein